MAQALTLARTHFATPDLRDWLRCAVVCGCAAALAVAGPILPAL